MAAVTSLFNDQCVSNNVESLIIRVANTPIEPRKLWFFADLHILQIVSASLMEHQDGPRMHDCIRIFLNGPQNANFVPFLNLVFMWFRPLFVLVKDLGIFGSRLSGFGEWFTVKTFIRGLSLFLIVIQFLLKHFYPHLGDFMLVAELYTLIFER